MTTSQHDSDLPGNEGAVAHQDPNDNGEERGPDAHGDEDILGPIDTVAWGAGVLGVVLGLAVGLAFALATIATT